MIAELVTDQVNVPSCSYLDTLTCVSSPNPQQLLANLPGRIWQHTKDSGPLRLYTYCLIESEAGIFQGYAVCDDDGYVAYGDIGSKNPDINPLLNLTSGPDYAELAC